MADEVQTRLQKEVATLQKEVQRIDASNEQTRSSIEQTRFDFCAGMDAMGKEMRQMFEKLLLKIDSNITAKNLIEPSGSTESRPIIVSDEKQFTEHSKLQCPRFNGDDFLGWKLKVEQFFAADNTEDKHKVLIAMMHLDGRALQWHQKFIRDKGSLHEVTWNQYSLSLQARFCDTESTNPFYVLVAHKHTNTVEEYFEEFESLLSLVDISEDQALGIFISNLKPEVEQRIRLFYPKTLNHAFNLAKQVEVMIFNLPRKPNIPYKHILKSDEDDTLSGLEVTNDEISAIEATFDHVLPP
ncbi:Retrotransposon gag protein [Corchorus capsularis]|uniref:Retrotransposon gag protein n=1 Tax=Corchorus capsularis TaxID=210143 RepID=A0A1R3JYD3_COCAP|nr:Retrotransposon gag protein [Corchorus capsularis]